jgi:hypothetical protein
MKGRYSSARPRQIIREKYYMDLKEAGYDVVNWSY